MIKAGIYKIENKVNGKMYIGSSFDVKNRLIGHKSALKKKNHDNRYLQFSINKYGLENFKFEVLELIFLSNKEELNCILKTEEAFYIELYKSYIKENGYNVMGAKEGRLVFTDEMKKNISVRQKEYHKMHPELKEGFANRARKTHTGRKRKDETKRKISEALKGRIARSGWHHSQKTKDILREKRLGIFKHTDESKQKISETGKGRIPWNKNKTGIYSEERLTRIKEARAKQVMPKWTAERYEKMKNKMPTNKGLPAHNRRKVIQLDAEMNVINIFDSLKEAALKTGAAHSNIGGCCKNPNRTSGGFKWMYEDDYRTMFMEVLLSA